LRGQIRERVHSIPSICRLLGAVSSSNSETFLDLNDVLGAFQLRLQTIDPPKESGVLHGEWVDLRPPFPPEASGRAELGVHLRLVEDATG
jgi:hypothetical protein